MTLFFKSSVGFNLFTILLLSLFRYFDKDELESVHTSWLMLNGFEIYIDFFQHHHPFFYHTISPLIDLFGENVSTLIYLRLVMFLLFLSIIYISGAITSLLFNDDKGVLWATLFFLTSLSMFSQSALEIRPDTLQTLFSLISIFLLLKNKSRPSLFLLFLSALMVAMALLFLQKAVFVTFSIFSLQCYWMIRKEFNWKGIFLYWLFFFIALSPYYFFLLYHHKFTNYLFWNWTLNFHFSDSFSPFITLRKSFLYNHFIWIFFIVGFIFSFIRKHYELLILCFTMLLCPFAVRAPYDQYFMASSPFVCIIAAKAAVDFFEIRRSAIFVFMLSLAIPQGYFYYNLIAYPNRDQLNKIDWILKNSSPNQYVYDGDIQFNIYRQDLDFFWYSTNPLNGGLKTFQKLNAYTYNIHDLINRCQPKIISSTFIKNLNHPVILNFYTPSTTYPDLFLRKD